MRKFAWFSFWLVAAIWGSSFLLIKLGVDQFTPGQIAFIRSLIAAIGLNAVMLMRGKRYPTGRRVWVAIVIVGIGNASLPYWLIGLSEQIITSSLASVIQATVPLFSLVIAHFALADEKINAQKVVGLVLGFVGVSMLALHQESLGGRIDGVLLMMLASLFYAMMTVFNRRTLSNRVEPIVIAASTFVIAAMSAGGIVLIEPVLGIRVENTEAIGATAWFAVLMLGVLNTFIAYLFFYYIIRELGAFRATNVTYVVPVFGVTLGALAGEPIDIVLIAGAALILSGIMVINLGGRVWTFVRTRTALAATTVTR